MSFRLILITSPEDFTDEIPLLEVMAERGLDFLHIRKPTKDRDSLAFWIAQLPERLRRLAVLHGSPDLALNFGLCGYHGLQYGPPRGDYVELQWSVSLHHPREARAFDAWQYAFLSPIFESFSKPGYRVLWDYAALGQWLEDFPGDVVALGGVDAQRMEILYQLGFAGAAVLGAVWNAADPLGAWDTLYASTRSAQGLNAWRYPPIASWRERMVARRAAHLLGDTW